MARELVARAALASASMLAIAAGLLTSDGVLVVAGGVALMASVFGEPREP